MERMRIASRVSTGDQGRCGGKETTARSTSTARRVLTGYPALCLQTPCTPRPPPSRPRPRGIERSKIGLATPSHNQDEPVHGQEHEHGYKTKNVDQEQDKAGFRNGKRARGGKRVGKGIQALIEKEHPPKRRGRGWGAEGEGPGKRECGEQRVGRTLQRRRRPPLLRASAVRYPAPRLTTLAHSSPFVMHIPCSRSRSTKLGRGAGGQSPLTAPHTVAEARGSSFSECTLHAHT
ncbi:hypothetical protein C8R45DRAFT_186557 [Mycena sanguinolenta]|nr:hypothetical protein C8R45DRAFT_186557 [Mycena sanguinolenta]